jgi:branched-chain amino acid transport system substrate-binding protein
MSRSAHRCFGSLLLASALTFCIPGGSEAATVGVVAPLSGEYARYGESFLKGARLAAQGTGIRLEVRDSRSDPVTAVAALRDLTASRDVVAVAGPMLSTAALAAATVADLVKVPVVLPVAMVEGLERFGPWSFQVNGSLPSLAKTLARHAVREEGLRRLAVLYPRTVYGTVLTRTFTQEAEAMGADVSAVVSYEEGQADFANELKVVKEARPQALFLAGSTGELLQIVPQVAFWQIECRLLGAYGWDSPRLMQVAGEVAEGAIVAVVRGGELRRSEAERVYRETYAGEPDRYALLGWDVVRALGEIVWTDRDVSRETVRRELWRLGWQVGASGGLLWSGSVEVEGEGVELRVVHDAGFVSPAEFKQLTGGRTGG